ncbi:MAG: pentapeptide repeat-containing protein [Deltaproteobacteria bacterium]|nr:pentapeptide repeat-containing protein [Deltaproteobacteria bacterium]
MRAFSYRHIIWFVIGLCLMGRAAAAGALQVPLLLNYQGMLTDGGGNPLPSGATPFLFRITDADGRALYEEAQTVDVVHGVAATLVGNGTEPQTGAAQGGLPPEILAPEAPRFLEVWVNNELVDTPLEIVSVPYAYWSATALHVAAGSVDGNALAPGSVTLQHLAEPVLGELATALAQTPALQALGGAGVGTAKAVAVDGSFAYSGANTLQEVLHDLDRAIKAREEKNLNKTGDSVSGPLTFVGDSGAATLTLDATSGDMTSTGDVVAGGGVSLAGGKVTVDAASGTMTFTAGARLTGLPPAQQESDAATWLDVKTAKSAIVGTDGLLNFADVQDQLPLSKLQIETFAAWDQDASNDLTVASAAGGDLGGPFGNLQLGAGVVGTVELSSGAVTAAKLADGAVGTAALANSAVTAPKLAAGAVTSAALAEGSVTSAALADNTVSSVDIADGTITGNDISDGTLTGADLASDSITSVQIAPGALSGLDLADNSVSSADIVDGTIGTADLANGAVTGAKVADGGLTGADIADNSLGSADIADGSVTSSDLQNNSVAGNKVIDESLTGFDLANGTITGADIGDGSVTGIDIANGTLTGNHIITNSLNGTDIEDGTLGGVDIMDGSLTGVDLADSTLGPEKLNFPIVTPEQLTNTSTSLAATPSVAKAWIKVGLQANGSYEIHSSYNVEGVTYVHDITVDNPTLFGINCFRITWDAPFKDGQYPILITSEEDNIGLRYKLDKNYIDIPVNIFGNNLSWIHVVAFGS